MSFYKFGKIEIASNKENDIFTIHLNQMMNSHKVSFNNWKDCWYITGYQVDGEKIIPLFFKTPKNIFSLDNFNMTKTQLIHCHSMFLTS